MPLTDILQGFFSLSSKFLFMVLLRKRMEIVFATVHHFSISLMNFEYVNILLALGLMHEYPLTGLSVEKFCVACILQPLLISRA
jgi:hypothetical protein